MTTREMFDGGGFILRVVIDVHVWKLVPAFHDTGNELLKGLLLFGRIERPYRFIDQVCISFLRAHSRVTGSPHLPVAPSPLSASRLVTVPIKYSSPWSKANGSPSKSRNTSPREDVGSAAQPLCASASLRRNILSSCFFDKVVNKWPWSMMHPTPGWSQITLRREKKSITNLRGNEVSTTAR